MKRQNCFYNYIMEKTGMIFAKAIPKNKIIGKDNRVMKKYEIKVMAVAILSLLTTIAFVAWAFISASDGVDSFYAVLSLFTSPLIWMVLCMVFGAVFGLHNNE